jgi:hypothetical protein
MRPLQSVAFLAACAVITLVSLETPSVGQQPTATIQGMITDQFGAVISFASVTVGDSSHVMATTTTNDQGVFLINALMPGKYIVRVEAAGFAPYENRDVVLSGGRRVALDIKLSVAIQKQHLTVSADSPGPGLDPDRNQGSIILKGADLDILPDDPDDLANALQAMAGPSAGLDGGQIFVDGFSNGSVPSKGAIREIRINQNPFAAEHDRIGFGRIEIFTRAGENAYHGDALLFYNNRAFNTQNPFVSNHPPYHFVFYGADLDGPIVNKRSTFTFSFFRRDIEDNAVVNATVLDASLAPVRFTQAVIAPRKFLDINPRFDHEFSKNNTLTLRYTYTRLSFENAGVGEFALPSRGYETTDSEHTLQISDTAILRSNAVNEFRFQYFRAQIGKSSNTSALIPTIFVRDSFIDGGPQFIEGNRTTDRFELQNLMTWLIGRHALRFGGRLRSVSLDDASTANFEGRYVFLGGVAPVLDANNHLVFGDHGFPLFESITSLEAYRRTLLFQRIVVGPRDITALGGNPTFLQITTGDPIARVNQVDFGGFFQDDWRLRPNFTLSYGLRYEAQSNVSSTHDLAPRLAFAWSPGMKSGRPPKTVIRGGAGIFYDRVSEDLILQATRFDGVRQSQFLIPGPALLGFYPQVPSAAALQHLEQFKTVVRVAPDLRVPYTVQSGISIERQWWSRITTSLAFVNARGAPYLMSRNINAPLPGTFDPRVPSSGLRPFGNTGNIAEYESSGIFKQHQLVLNASGRLGHGMSLFASYFLARADSDTDGPDTFPANSYDLKSEFGPSSLDIRHRAFVGLSIRLPWSLTANSFLIASSGVPFSILSGTSVNGDLLAAERPAFATDLSQASVKVTKYGSFDLNPAPAQQIIPRNSARGPGYASMSLRLGRSFSFGDDSGRSGQGTRQADPRATLPNERTGRSTGQASDNNPPVKRSKLQAISARGYTLTVSVLAFNIFNHVNPGSPVGDLSSPLFGQSNTLGTPVGVTLAGGNAVASNRRIDINVRLTF